jgi:hypothetical protein
MQSSGRQLEAAEYGMSDSRQSSAWIVDVQWREMLGKSLSLYATVRVFRFHS